MFQKLHLVPLPKKTQITYLNDYRPVALTYIILKCFEQLVIIFITSSFLDFPDPLQFTYRGNSSTDNCSLPSGAEEHIH